MSGTIESQLRYHAKHPDTPPPLRGLMLRAVEELRYRAMVIEQRNAEIKRGHDDFVQAITDPENQPSQWGTVTLAMYEKLELDTVAPAPQAQPAIKQSFTVVEQSAELDAGMAAQHYCRGLWGAARGHADWRKVHEHFANGYKQGRYDELQVQGPAPQPAQGEPTGCACRWDADDNRVATCARHQGWLDVVHEWAERAKAAEAALQSAQPKQEPLRALTDEEILSLEKQTPAMNDAGEEWIYFARAVLKKARGE